MRYYLSLIAIALIGISILTACQNVDTPTMETAKTAATETPKTESTAKPEDPLAKVPRISLADAKKAFDEGKVVFVDTRAEVQYREEHVKGSINIPAEAFEMRFGEVPKDKKIITYCS
jgi:hypothetical protein